MEFLTSRDLRLNPKQVWKRLRKAGIGIVTLKGKPQFVLSSIDPAEFEEVLYLLSRVRAEIAIEHMTKRAKEKALDRLTMEEIDEIIEKGKRK